MCIIYVVLLMRTMRRRKWSKELVSLVAAVALVSSAMLSTDECGSGGNLGDGGSMHDDVSVQGETNFNDVHAWVGQG